MLKEHWGLNEDLGLTDRCARKCVCDRAVDENSFVSNPSWIFHTTLTTYKSSPDPRVRWLGEDLCCHVFRPCLGF